MLNYDKLFVGGAVLDGEFLEVPVTERCFSAVVVKDAHVAKLAQIEG